MKNPKDELAFLKEQVQKDGDVYPAIRRAIVELYLPPGAILSIKEICDQFNIGRSPARDALLRLDQEGLVTLLPQRGTMIAQMDRKRAEQEYFLRCSVEEHVLERFMALHTPTDLLSLQEKLWEHEVYCNRPNMDIRKALELDDEFHAIFYKAVGCQFSLDVVTNMGGHYRRLRLLASGDSAIQREAVRQHNRMIAAFQARDMGTVTHVFRMHTTNVDRDWRRTKKEFPRLFQLGENPYSQSMWHSDYYHTIKK